MPPEGFVELKEVIPDIIYDIRYAGSNNFIGKPINGYQKPVAILSEPAAKALFKVQQDLKSKGYQLKVFDAYRSQGAVDHFVKWAANPDDTLMKKEFYPDVHKKDLFRLGYIAEKSGHSRGSTIDLSLVKISTQQELDMGSPYDFFGEISHHDTPFISAEQEANRAILKGAMLARGFAPYLKEWWHYTLEKEPYPDTYFDFIVRE